MLTKTLEPEQLRELSSESWYWFSLQQDCSTLARQNQNWERSDQPRINGQMYSLSLWFEIFAQTLWLVAALPVLILYLYS